jgi:predicted ferric reductase
MMHNEQPREGDLAVIPQPPAPRTILLTGLAIGLGVLAAALALPAWLPGLSASLLGAEPKAYWYLSRASGLVAFGLVWFSMAWGLLLTSRAARRWPGVASAGDLHQHASLLGLGFGFFHGLILLGDRFANYSLAQILVPFAASAHKPLWVGIGQLCFYLFALVTFSFYIRPWLGNGMWRAIHLLSFAVYLMALAHGVMSGTDTSSPWIQAGYWASAGTLLFLTIYRVLVARLSPARPERRPVAT